MVVADAYERYHAQACREGIPPDALRKFSPNEVERFWAYTVPGPDGHVYWTGGKEFRRNEGAVPRETTPARWVWFHYRGLVPMTTSVTATCGEKNCVALAHLKAERREGLTAYVPDHKILGRLQIVADELGRTPTLVEWNERGERPVAAVIARRFGGWDHACRHANLAIPARVTNLRSAKECIAALRAVAKVLRRPPSQLDFGRHGDLLREKGLPTSKSTIAERLAKSWPEALRKAGLK